MASVKNKPDVVVVDLCKADTYAKTHIPGAIHIEYSQIVSAKPPVMGLVPDQVQLATLMSQAGINPEDTIVVYDDEGGGKAARFIYTLDIIGHKHYALLNGGIHAWASEGYPLESAPNRKTATHYDVSVNPLPVADKEFIKSRLGQSNLQLIDARSPAEYHGDKKFTEKAGHIPGAINLDWMNFIDLQNNFRLKPKEEILQLLKDLDIESNKPTVVYCQTHHRSALTYFVLKLLGFKDVKGYPGSWSDWGNSPETPVASGYHYA